jgi:hypothetical protein
MPLELPNLDDRRYKDLVEEGRSLIPTYAPEWTNHNPSDPGITLIELFAYLTEMMNYRLNRVTVENKTAFLKLLKGPDWQPDEATVEYVNDEIRNAVQELRRPGRAITCDDFESLITASSDSFNSWLEEMRQNESNGGSLADWWNITGLEAVPENNPSAMAGKIREIGRARCVPRRNLITQTQYDSGTEKPGHISLVIVPERTGDESNPQPGAELVRAVRNYLELRRLLTTVVHVAGPRYFAVGVRLTVVLKPDADEDEFRFKFLGEWNGTGISSQLRQAFLDEEIDLSLNVAVSAESDSEWTMTDESAMKTYTIRNNEFNIYEPPAGETQFLFTFRDEWDGNGVSPELRQAFMDHGITLSLDAAVSAVSESEWLLTDESAMKTYTIRNGEFNIYEPPAGEAQFLFTFQGEWDGNGIPLELHQAFLNHGIEPTFNVTVSAMSESEWLLTDESTLKTYVVRKEDGSESVNIYEEIARYEVISALKKFLDPLDGGDDGKGRPFGRNVYVSEIFELLDGLSWVDYVTRTGDDLDDLDEFTVDAAETSRLIRNESGDLISVEIQPYELAYAGITPADISIRATRSA